ncbi:hypothetical protein [Streptomyces sp. SudanB182_2057]|uniref:hypothetical protein n=1 Tax=Streptomyces sp. SudanB182_2057 TaxID=3035281 RepID=UPI003F57FF21
MSQHKAAMDLVAGYGAYVSIEGMNVDAMSDAPATSPACIISAIESAAASYASATVISATISDGC